MFRKLDLFPSSGERRKTPTKLNPLERDNLNRLSLVCSVRQLLVTANVVPSSPILVTLMMEALRSSETSVLTRATRRSIPGDGFLQRAFKI
jgi:hypothetical protein